MPDLSIIIVNYKTPRLIIDCLQSVYQHTNGITFEVIVVDNQSGDDSQAQVQAVFPQVRWYDMGYNAGFARANNLGIRQATGRTVLLLNSDTLLIDNLLERCVRVLDQQPDVAAVGAHQLGRDRQLRPNLYTTFGQMRRAFYIIPPTQAAENWLKRRLPDPSFPDPAQVEWISGAFLMTRPDTIARAGGLDESFFMYGEDVEWGYRLGKQGRLLLLPDSAFIHLEYGSSTDHQQHVVTHINRFKPQVQVSQLLWVRKQYGPGAYLVLILHYITLIPIIFLGKMAINLRQRQPLLADLDNQRAFAQQVGIFLQFFWPTLLNKPGFYKV
ncbi:MULTISPECIES: glycosyltransferase family 2 protein [Spirosoma]|uniref:Glycosyltransferase family 2 protein n=1 Tax=Spirosoma sordidisoli TaxID=2502893 RepID=A0A4Q2UDB5_9BACT|nr:MULTISPECIES: glycosyltransferase family 2 protein [Spirosoma]RYC66914.1 glycosyltransferase family 2 protein [Spirosoma sordidisoli]